MKSRGSCRKIRSTPSSVAAAIRSTCLRVISLRGVSKFHSLHPLIELISGGNMARTTAASTAFKRLGVARSCFSSNEVLQDQATDDAITFRL